MLLKVGELARRSGMSVRMLHHYDAIDLLKPSARTEVGYRLYDLDDIHRLHAIQALRQIGLSLHEVGSVLQEGQEPLPQLIQRQMSVLEHQIEQATELHGRLGLLKSSLSNGSAPDMEAWLSMLTMMSTYGKYFKASELKEILPRWGEMRAKWTPLIAAVREAMQKKIPPDALEIQPLARRWMGLNARWMKGDVDLMQRWQKMYAQEPAAQGKDGIDLEMANYIGRAIELRLQAYGKYFTEEEMRSFDTEMDDDWIAMAERMRKLIGTKARPSGKKAQELIAEWIAMLDQLVGGNQALRERFMLAFAADPFLRAGSVFNEALSAFISAAVATWQESHTTKRKG